jgi:ABC-type branched-subunit amino acid transport system substrate-binding protein
MKQDPIARVGSIFRQLSSIFLAWILLPFIGALIGAMIISRIVNQVLAPNSYKVYVVGNMGKSTAAQTIAQALAGCDLKEFRGVPLDVVKRDDEGEPSQARRLAQDITGQPDTLLVIGHIGSGQTKEALPIYLAARPPIPVILATETTPNLVPVAVTPGTYMPVLRLWPTDREQARVAAHFIAKRVTDENAPSKQNAIWVVQDVSGDTVYSEFLANEFIREVQRRRAKVVLWTTNLSVPTAHALRALDIGWVFFAGNWPAALVLIRELRSVYASSSGQGMPSIVLSDACMDQQLIDEGGQDVQGVYLSFPMRVSKGGKEYSQQAENVCNIVRTLLEDEDYTADVYRLAQKNGGFLYELRSILGVKRVKDARRLLSSRIQSAEDQAEAFTLANGSKIRFARKDQDAEVGARIDADATFYIWQVRKGADLANANKEDFADVSPTK